MSSKNNSLSSDTPEQKERRKIPISRTERAQVYVEHPKSAVYQFHEATPKQMVQIFRQLNTLDSLEALHNWIYSPPKEKIVLSLVVRLRNVDNLEAEFLLRNLSQHRSSSTYDDMLREMQRVVKDQGKK
jgi:hypothetical protein